MRRKLEDFLDFTGRVLTVWFLLSTAGAFLLPLGLRAAGKLEWYWNIAAGLAGFLITGALTLLLLPKGQSEGKGSRIKAGKAFKWEQREPAATWTIKHDLGYKPAVRVIDSAGSVVIGDVRHLGENEVVVSFSGAFSGEAYLS